jgi:hypothetical protein
VSYLQRIVGKSDSASGISLRVKLFAIFCAWAEEKKHAASQLLVVRRDAKLSPKNAVSGAFGTRVPFSKALLTNPDLCQ